MLPQVLIVEDSPMVMKIIRHVAQQYHQFEFLFAESFAEAKKITETPGVELFAALVDLNLPDAPNGEVVDYVLNRGINTIVLTASFDEQKREMLLSKGIVDYVTKEGRFSYQYAINLIQRIYKNQSIKVMIVDDSDTSRFFVKNLLSQHLFKIVEARNGIEAVKVLLDNADIKLLITDFQMPQMNGLELIQNIRHKYEKSNLAIVGLSGEGEDALSAKFIKAGANDFLHKPFNHEEFHCRVRHIVEELEHIEQIRDAANRDYLTGVYNRRYFFTRGKELHQHACDNQSPMAAAIIDLDHFKKINDHYGYEGGDYVLQEVTSVLSESLERFLIARPSGEEFFVLMPGLDNAKAVALVRRLQDIINETPIELNDETLHVSFSAGVTNQIGDSLTEQLHIATGYLNRAKQAGRNLVIGDD